MFANWNRETAPIPAESKTTGLSLFYKVKTPYGGKTYKVDPCLTVLTKKLETFPGNSPLIALMVSL